MLTTNLIILLLIIVFVLQKPTAEASNTSSVNNISATSVGSQAPDPLDQVASANIALTVAQMSNLPEQTPINNQADSQQAEIAIASTSDELVNKPQVTQTALKSRSDIAYYTVAGGDTLASIATKFGVTSDSIMWSNNITDNNVTSGQRLVIPPVNGIVYTVKAGDTTASLAQKYQASEAQIIAYNDAAISGIYAGEKIIIPNGTIANTVAASPVASNWTPSYASNGSNGYDYGYCTWYVASMVPVPNNWGNAATWSYYAAHSGWNVSSSPVVGAIAQTPYAAGGEGHVAIVEAVSPDGTQIKFSDMNGLAGWGRVGYSGWVSASTFTNYISH